MGQQRILDGKEKAAGHKVEGHVEGHKVEGIKGEGHV